MTRYLVIAVVILGLIAAIVFGAKSYVDRVDEKAYQRGQQEAENAYRARDNAQLQAALAEVQRLQEQIRATEERHQLELTQAEANNEKDRQNLRARDDRIVSRLRQQLDQARASGAAGNQCPGASPPADPGGSELAGWRAQLSDDDVRFLIGEARAADMVLGRLNLCRQTLEIERR